MAYKSQKNNNDVLTFLHAIPDMISAGINVAQLARVDRLYENNQKAQVQPLAKKSDGSSRAPLIGVHVGKLLRDVINVGDIVVVIFMDRSMAAFDGTANEFPLVNNRMHSVNDAFIIEVY